MQKFNTVLESDKRFVEDEQDEEDEEEEFDLENTAVNIARTIPDDHEVNSKIHSEQKLVTEPPVNMQDKLWSEIDALDDVRRLAKEDNLFSEIAPNLEKRLVKIRDTHVKLLQVMRDRNAIIEEQQRLRITSGTATTLAEGTGKLSKLSKQETNPVANLKNRLFNKEQGKEYQEEVTEIMTEDTNQVSYVQINNDHLMPVTEENEYINEMIDLMRELRA